MNVLSSYVSFFSVSEHESGGDGDGGGSERGGTLFFLLLIALWSWWSWLNVVEVVLGGGTNGLGFSPVSGSLETSGSIHLSLEVGDNRLLDWVDVGEHVPVNVASAWRSGEGSLVNPSVLEIKGVQEGLDWEVGHSLIGGLVPLQGGEEIVDGSDGSSWDSLGHLSISGEYDTEDTTEESVSWSRGLVHVDDVHLEVELLTIDLVLRLSVEVELGALELLLGREWSSAGKVRVEQLLAGGSDLGLGSQTGGIPLDGGGGDILVSQFQVVLVEGNLGVVLEAKFAWGDQVDWRLVSSSAVVGDTGSSKIWPVTTIGALTVVILVVEGHTSGRDGGGSEEEHGSLREGVHKNLKY